MSTPKSFSFTRGHIHCWQGVADVLVSDEAKKRLLAFATWNAAVNHLFVTGRQETARALNAALNEASIEKEEARTA